MTVKQTKLESLLETVINVAMGYIVAMAITLYIIVPLWGLDWGFHDSFMVTMIYTIAAITRGYIVRRFFNAEIHKAAHALAIRIIK